MNTAIDYQSQAQSLFNRASARIMCNKDTAFYSAMLMQMPIVWTTTVTPTAAVDAYSKLYLNPIFVASKTVDEIIFLLIHECEHLLGLHPLRLNNRDPREWNLATDAVINANLKRNRIGRFIEGGVDVPEAWNKTADELYNSPPPDDGGNGGESGDDIGGTGDDLIYGDGEGNDSGESGNRPMTKAELGECEVNAKQIIANAAQAARVAGTLSADMKRRIDDILAVKTPWFEILERFMLERSSSDYSWSRPNRRFISSGIYLPSMQSIAALGEVAIIRDVSMSITTAEHRSYIGHINAIFERCKPTHVRVLDTSTVVHHCHEFTADDLPMNPELMGGGGTDLRAGFDYINDKLDPPAVCIVFTDGYTDWPTKAPDYPVVVVCTTDTEVNFGDEVIRYEPPSNGQ